MKKKISLLLTACMCIVSCVSASAEVKDSYMGKTISNRDNVEDGVIGYRDYFKEKLNEINDHIISIKYSSDCAKAKLKYISWYLSNLNNDGIHVEGEDEYTIENTTEITTAESITEGITEITTSENTIEEYKISEMASKVIELTNNEREKRGIAPLSVNISLVKAAEDHAKDMYDNNYFSHTSKDGREPEDRVRKYDSTLTYIGENIAKNQMTPEEVVEDWMSSDGHRKNILNDKYKYIGVAYYNGYWVQDFGS